MAHSIVWMEAVSSWSTQCCQAGLVETSRAAAALCCHPFHPCSRVWICLGEGTDYLLYLPGYSDFWKGSLILIVPCALLLDCCLARLLSCSCVDVAAASPLLWHFILPRSISVSIAVVNMVRNQCNVQKSVQMNIPRTSRTILPLITAPAGSSEVQW